MDLVILWWCWWWDLYKRDFVLLSLLYDNVKACILDLFIVCLDWLSLFFDLTVPFIRNEDVLCFIVTLFLFSLKWLYVNNTNNYCFVVFAVLIVLYIYIFKEKDEEGDMMLFIIDLFMRYELYFDEFEDYANFDYNLIELHCFHQGCYELF